MTAPRESLYSLRDRWHVLMGEAWGWLSGYALIRIAKHAAKAEDIVTIYRVRTVIHAGADAGWDKNRADRGRIVPRRNDEVAAHVRRLREESNRG